MSVKNNLKLKNYFKKQFPNGIHEESFEVETDWKYHLSTFEDCNLDIGWVLGEPTKKRMKDRIVKTKRCMGTVRCINSKEKCVFAGKDMKPKSNRDLIAKQKCIECNGPVEHQTCFTKAVFSIHWDNEKQKNICTVKCDMRHLHGEYKRTHLSGETFEKFVDVVEANKYITPKKLTIGLSSRSGDTMDAARDLDPILSNKDRVKLELGKAMDLLGISKSAQFLGEFLKIQKEYPGYITYAQVATDETFIVTFMAPKIKSYQLPFASQPFVTDVTYKAISDTHKYVCSSVIYVPSLRCNVVFFQAIIGGLAASNFADYFIQLFKQMGINKNQLLGQIMDFSAAQRLGFIHAFNFTYNNSADGSGSPDQMTEALSFLKGCYMHYMQSVQRIISNHNVVPPESKKDFLRLVYRLRTTESSTTFVQTVLSLSIDFPECRKWLSWWLQPSVSSMIFRYNSKMKADLSEHPMRTSNSVESFHSVLYRSIDANSPMPHATRQLLKMLKNGYDTVRLYYDLGVAPSYGTKPRTKTSRRLIKYYSQSDSRAPDNSEALFGDVNSQVNKRKREQEEAHANYFDGIVSESQKKRAAIAHAKTEDFDAVAVAKDDMELVMGKTITCEEDLASENLSEETPFFHLLELDDRKDVTAEGMDEDVFDEVKLLLADDGAFDCDFDYGDFMDDEDGKEDSKKGDDVRSIASSANDDFSFDLSTDDITMLDNVAASSAGINKSFFNGPGPVYCELPLNANADASCYLDAPLEIIARCVFPYVKKSFEAKCRMNNIIDAALLASLKEYDQGNSVKGNQMFREFVWRANDLFKKGAQNDVNLSFAWILDNMSPQLRSLMSFGRVPQFSLCRQSPSHASFKMAQLQWLPCVNQCPTMKDILVARSIVDKNKQMEAITRLDNDFSASFAQHLLRQLREVSYCSGCNQKCALKCNIITEESLPPFFFLADPTNSDPLNINFGRGGKRTLKEENIQPYFPPQITIRAPLPVTYDLHARLYSSALDGQHYFSVGKMMKADSTQGIFKMDNLFDKCKELTGSPSDGLNAAKNTIIVCYKRSQ